MILRRATGDNDPDDFDHSDDEPQLFATGRAVSLAGLLERIEAEFNAETDGRFDLLDTDEARRDMIRDVVEYVLATESIKLERGDRLAVVDAVYEDLFRAGPLEAAINDPAVTEIQIKGPTRIYARRGVGDMREIDAQFADSAQLERFLQRKGAFLSEPFLEIGTRFGNRPARLTITSVPISPEINIDIRLHPSTPLTLDELVEHGMLDASAVALLRAILAKGHGLMLAGDVGTGKTTLLQALALEFASIPDTIISVERASELRLPANVESLHAIPASPLAPPEDFPDQIRKALESQPAWLILDEVRFDESAAMWEALTASAGHPGIVRCVWAFRGATEPLRLRTAFGMSVRRAVPGIEQEAIHSALMDKLPFVVLMGKSTSNLPDRSDRILKVLRIGEWQYENAAARDLSQIALRQIWPVQDGVSVSPVRPVAWSG